MNTDEMILELVKTGKFTLPACLEYVPESRGHGWCADHDARWKLAHNLATISASVAHDLCAMHFAREAQAPDSVPFWHGITEVMRDAEDNFRQAVYLGDSAAAIAALHGAVCAPA